MPEFIRARFCWLLLMIALSATLSLPATSQNRLVVPSFDGSEIKLFDAATGAFLSTMAGGIRADCIAIGPDGNYYAGNELDHTIVRYDGTTGASMGVFASGGGLNRPGGIAFGLNGDLFVTDYPDQYVKRYSGTTGAYLGSFASGPGMLRPYDLQFGPDGRLYVCCYESGKIMRFNGTTGAYIDDFIKGGDLTNPTSFDFDPDGNIFVGEYASNNVKKYNGSNGAYLGDFTAPGSGGLTRPQCVRFGPDGNLYVASYGTDQVLRYNGASGAFIDIFASGSGLNGPAIFTFEPRTSVLASQTGDFVADGGKIWGYSRLGGRLGIHANGLGRALGIEYGPDGKIYVADNESPTGDVRRFLPDGTPDGIFCSTGAGTHPIGLAFGPDGRLYVSLRDVDRLSRFLPNGAPDGTFGDGLDFPYGIRLGPDGAMYVACLGDQSVVRVPLDGGAQTTAFSGHGQVDHLDFDSQGEMYVGCTAEGVIRRANDASVFATVSAVEDVRFDGFGVLWVTTGSRILRILPDGTQRVVQDGMIGAFWLAMKPRLIVHAGPDQNITVTHDGRPETNTANFTLNGSTDPDNDSFTYEWQENQTVLGSTATLELSRTPGVYTFTLVVTDPFGASLSDEVIVLVSPEPNAKPVANAGPDQTVAPVHGGATAPFSLGGAGSSDPDNDSLTYEWKEGDAVVGTLVALDMSRTPGTYTFTLKVTDAYGADSTDTVNITVDPPPNGIPNANAGPDQTKTIIHDGDPATNTAVFTLDGSVSSDPDNDPLTYEWREGATLLGTTATIELSRKEGYHIVTLTVTDPFGAAHTDDVIVTINPEPNEGPVASAGDDQTKTTGSNGLAPFTLDATGSSDPEGDPLIYEWTEMGSVVGDIAKLDLSRTPGTYIFYLVVADPYGRKSFDEVQVTINLNYPPIAYAGSDFSVTPPHDGDPATITASFTLDSAGSTDPNNDPLTYVWKEGEALLGTTATLALSRTVGTYTFTLTVSDPYGGSSSDSVNITVNDEPNAEPVAYAGTDQFIVAARGAEMTHFTLDGSGSFDQDADSLTYEWMEGQTVVGTTPILGLSRWPGTYTFVLTVTDSYGATSSDYVDVTVSPPTNGAPTANAGPDQTVTLPHDYSPGGTVTFMLNGTASTDPDNDTLTYEWKHGPDTIGNTAIIEASSTEGIATYTLIVTDPDGASSTDEVTVTILPAPNTPPVANAGPDQAVRAGTNGTATFIIYGDYDDPDGDPLYWEWREGNAVVSYATSLRLTREPGTYTITLWVRDTYGAIASDDAIITVLPNSFPPVANAGPDQTKTVPHDGSAATNTASFTLDGRASTDPDNDVLTYDWKQVTATGTTPVGATATLNLSRTAGVHTFRLTVSDGRGGSSTDEVVITINPETNRPPNARAGSDQTVRAESSGLAAIRLNGSSSTDPDGDVLRFEWTEDGEVVGTTAILDLERAAGPHRFVLKVTDLYEATSTDEVDITVVPNGLPVANAGADQTKSLLHDGSAATNTASFTLDGRASTDPDNDTLTYDWKQVTAAGTTPVGGTATLNLSRTAGVHTFRLTVSDGRGGSSTDEVVITINPEPNQPPIAKAGSDQTMRAGTSGTASVSLNGGGSSDPDGDKLIYEWKQGSKIVGSAAKLNLSLKSGTYVFTLKVTDPYGSSSSDSVLVSIVTR
jgi:hypothetical protein